jgi:hypothetical protein
VAAAKAIGGDHERRAIASGRASACAQAARAARPAHDTRSGDAGQGQQQAPPIHEAGRVLRPQQPGISLR